LETVFDGYWLPRPLRERVLTDAAWETVWLKGGALTTESVPGAVAVRWPRLTSEQWHTLLNELQRARPISAHQIMLRWQTVLETIRAQLLDHAADMMPVISACTGYSPQMLAITLGLGDMVSPQSLSAALEFRPTWSAATGWERIPGLPGRVRFFPQRMLDRIQARFRSRALMCRPAPPVDLALGYAAGNVPGTALLIALLGGLANYLADHNVPAPAVLIRNSRHEPLFAPWVLSAVEAIDPELVASLAVLIWDYTDEMLQRDLIRRAGLMIAAAGDETIAALEAVRAKFAPSLRFHRHGHKVSFAVIGQGAEISGQQSAIAFLAALDSALWDQNGCLSARIHFVEGNAEEYAQALAEQMRMLSTRLPRGTTPRRFVHRAFDIYGALVGSGQVRVCSTYDDDFAVILDARAWEADRVRQMVNVCQGRVIIVRPIKDVMEVSDYLRGLPAANLQSISAAMDNCCVLEFAEAIGACGVTAIRSLGRAAFPQLAYSWDGLLPLDVGHLRPPGHFTTIEFDDLPHELSATAERWRL